MSDIIDRSMGVGTKKTAAAEAEKISNRTLTAWLSISVILNYQMSQPAWCFCRRKLILINPQTAREGAEIKGGHL